MCKFHAFRPRPIIYIGVIILFINLFSLDAFAQKFTANLIWTPTINISDSLVAKDVMHFNNAEYQQNGLPYYSKTIPYGKSNVDKIFSIKLENTVFIALTKDEKKTISKENYFNTEIKYEANTLIARGVPTVQVKVFPFRKNKNTGEIEKLVSFNYTLNSSTKSNYNFDKQKYSSNSVLRQAKWIKIRVENTGVYSLTFDQLISMGIENPENVRIFGNSEGMLSFNTSDVVADDLIENDILIQSNSIIFYAKGPDRWDYDENNNQFNYVNNLYSNYSYYFLSSDYNSSYNNNIKTYSQPSSPVTHTATTFNDRYIHEVDIHNLARSGRRWYGETFDVNLAQNFTFAVNNIANNSTAKADIRVAAAAGSSSSFDISVANYSENISISRITDHVQAVSKGTNFNFNAGTSSNIIFSLTYNRLSPSWKAWLDYIQLNVKRNLIFSGNQMTFSNYETLGAGNITQYKVSGVSSGDKIWDITIPTNPMNISYSLSGSLASFKAESSELKRYIIFKSSSFLNINATYVEEVANQNLHAAPGNTELLIVTHPNFLTQALELKKLHEEKDNMNVYLATTDQVYNEFSSGARDISAIRNFARMIYSKATTTDTLRYLLLLGDGSYDNKTDSSINSNYIPTFQSLASESQTASYVTDDYFGLMDVNEGEVNSQFIGLMDIGVGRINVSTIEQANGIIAKIKSYTSPETFGDWRNKFCFIADDENGVVHMADADTLTRYIKKFHPAFNIEKIYLDAYPQQTVSGGERYPDVNAAFSNRVKKGAVLINYTGHGGEYGLAHERILTISEIDSWNNFDKLPFFVTATCEFTRFDDYKFLTAGERVFLNPNGGGIAMFTTARLAWIGYNASFTKSFYRNIFNKVNGKKARMGDISRLTKNEFTGTEKLIFFMIGDPALEIAFPGETRAITKTINQSPVTIVDTLKALSKATFTGEMQDAYGNKLTNFNGFVYPTVYDKEREINTLNNDGAGVFTFLARNNIIYRGKSTVKNGDFSFEFIVPRDIMLNVDTGKVSYYAENGIVDGAGYSYDFLVGDISDSYPEDNTGPEIKLYMNNENFVSGGITNNSPAIFAKVSDENGINTSTGGIGHDITAVIDNDVKNIIVLNEDYRADADTYKSGELEHFLFDIPAGEHNLKLKVWDVYNNSSEEEIDFIVIEEDNLTIERLLNYPNPFTTHTDFYFEHNMAGTQIDVMIQIFTVSGKLVKTINETILADGYRAGPFSWNGTDDFGNDIGRGVYVYRVKIRSFTGETVEKYEKLLILK